MTRELCRDENLIRANQGVDRKYIERRLAVDDDVDAMSGFELLTSVESTGVYIQIQGVDI
jgi:hypothetical protein